MRKGLEAIPGKNVRFPVKLSCSALAVASITRDAEVCVSMERCGREVEGRWKEGGREVEGRWKGGGREVEERWKGGGREVEGRWKRIGNDVRCEGVWNHHMFME